jgi:predicted nucleic acid-binding Zn ribbon protein
MTDKVLSLRNDPNTGTFDWTGERELIWHPEDQRTGTEQGLIAGHISYAAQLILHTPSLWNQTVPDGNPYGYGATYRQRGGSATNDEWELRSIGSGYYRIINRNSGKDLTVQSASTAEGANIFQYTYGGATTNDEWAIVSVGSGYYRLTNRNSGKAAIVTGGSTADGANVEQRSYTGAPHQQFQLVSISVRSTVVHEPSGPMTHTPAVALSSARGHGSERDVVRPRASDRR